MTRRRRPERSLGVAPSLENLRPTSFPPREIVGAALRAMVARPARSLLTASGTVIGMAALVATISLTATAQQQITEAFAALEINEISVTVVAPEGRGPSFATALVELLQGRADVAAAGVFQAVEGSVHVQISPFSQGRMVGLYSLDEHVLRVVAPQFSWGGNDFSSDRGRVALLADSAARSLGLTEPAPGQTLLVNGHTFSLGGIIHDVAVHNELLLGIAVPPQDAVAIGLGPMDSFSVFAVPGNVNRLASALPHLASPYDPGAALVSQRPTPERLRQQVGSSVRQLLLLLAVVAFGISGLGIANTTLTAVMERTTEIGLQRALGARRRHIAAQTMTESGLLGLMGALVGVWLGAMTTVISAAILQWQPVLDLRAAWLGPIAGLAVGVAAGLYPAMRAANLQPAEVLRR